MVLLLQWSTRLNFSGSTFIVGLLFMLPWGLLLLRQPNIAFQNVIANWPILLLPALALASTIWSDYSAWTLRAGIQYFVTFVIGVLAGTCLKPKALLSAFLSASALVSFLSILNGSTGGSSGGEVGLIGLFGSKNYFAFSTSLLLLVALVVAFDRSQPAIFRALGFAAAASAPMLLFYARSAGAIVDVAAACAIMALLYFAARLAPLVRALVLTFLVFFGISLVVAGTFFLDEVPDLLGYMGKDVTLTGRTYLWQRAFESIAAHPILGVGYQAFWQIGNWAAEDLWLYSGITGKSGFHFHNLYLQVTVDLGFVGLAVLVSMLAIMLVRAIIALSGSPRHEQMFAISVFIFLLLRTPIEVDSFFQFDVSTLMTCLIWIYLRPIAAAPQSSLQRRLARYAHDQTTETSD
jgi:exopolysaccharide production protein ExoQ